MSKLSIHISGSPTGLSDLLLKCANDKSPVGILYSVNQNVSDDIARRSPTTLWVYRRQSETFNRLPNNFFQGDPAQSARDWLVNTRDGSDRNRNQIENILLNNPTYADVLNEPAIEIADPNNPAQVAEAVRRAKWLNTWMLTALEIAHSHGVKLAMFSFPTQSPPSDARIWNELLPSMRLGKVYGAILSLHCYGDPRGDNPPGYLFNRPEAYLQHRDIYALLTEDARLPVIYSEAGAGNGYNTGVKGLSFVADMGKCDDSWILDSTVLAGCAFQLGVGVESNMAEIMGPYGDYIASHPNVVVPPQPIESPDGTSIPPTDKIVDSSGHAWTLGSLAVHGRIILRDGAQFAGGQGVLLLYYSKKVYTKNDLAEWYVATDSSWIKISEDPRPSKIKLVSPVLGIPLKITNPFDAPCNYANGKHEGIDFRAYNFNSKTPAKISPAYEGTVEFIRTTGYSSAGYGKYIIINHVVGGNIYKTWYCHLASVNVSVGQLVKPGNVIGVGGATGTAAIHLHFNLQWIGNGLHGYYVDDVVNPAPYFLEEVPPIPPEVTLKSGVGVGNMYPFTPQELDAMSIGGAQTVLLLTMPDYNEMRQAVQSVRAKLGSKTDIVGRLFFPEDGTPYTPQEAIAYCRNGLQGMYDEGIREFQVGNEPNIYPGGMGWMWSSGVKFAAWLDTTLSLLRAQYPNCRWGYPALSPQPNTESFFRDSKTVADKCDWVGVHAYWWTWSGGAYNAIDESGGMSWSVVARQTTKPLYLTEYSCNTPYTSYAEKGVMYRDYISLLRQGGRISKAHSFCLSWDQDKNREAWVIGSGRNQITDIPKYLGA